MSLSASLNQIWAMVNTQQLLVLMPLMKVVLPHSVAEFYKNIFAIAAFDFYELNDFYNELL